MNVIDEHFFLWFLVEFTQCVALTEEKMEGEWILSDRSPHVGWLRTPKSPRRWPSLSSSFRVLQLLPPFPPQSSGFNNAPYSYWSQSTSVVLPSTSSQIVPLLSSITGLLTMSLPSSSCLNPYGNRDLWNLVWFYPFHTTVSIQNQFFYIFFQPKETLPSFCA